MNHKSKQISSSLLLALTALIWGASFVAQSVGMDHVGPFTFNSVRSILGGTVLLPVIIFQSKKNKVQSSSKEDERKARKSLLIGGLSCGIALAISSSIQQIGISYTTVGKAGFITALYIVIVPIMGLFLKKKVHVIIWLSVVLATIGLYLISITEGLTIGRGDFLILLCALGFSVHILIIDHYSPRVDVVKLSCIQFFVAGILCGIPMFAVESPDITSILDAAAPIMYSGIMSSGVGYTLQMVGQKHVKPVLASLILSMEAVFAALSGWLILGETLSARELLGCAFVFVAILLAQIPDYIKVGKQILAKTDLY
ncbi:MAG TPA: DMT family transporter [Clostridiales bacterium]|nr:DMT family transporter [Clostridiales bacterium]